MSSGDALENSSTDEILMAQVGAGDALALGAIYDRYGRLAFHLAYRILDDTGPAEDVVQDVFLAIWQRAGTFDPRRGALRPWLFTTVRNRCIDVLRGPRPPLDLEIVLASSLATSTDDDPVERTIEMLEAEDIRLAVDRLPENQRMTVSLAFYRGLTHREIADQMNVPLGTVKGRLRLALDKLRDTIGSASGSSRASGL